MWWVAGRRLTHGGADAGFRAAFDCFPNDDASVVVLSNGSADVGAIAQALADAFLKPAPPQPQLAEPDPALLAQLPGYYCSGWGPGFTLEGADGKLMARNAAGAVGDVKFLSNGQFYLTSPAARLSTQQPDGGLREIQSVGGLPMTHGKREPWRPSADELTTLAGRYHSDEIDSTYDLAVDGDGFTLTALRLELDEARAGRSRRFRRGWMLLDRDHPATHGGAPTGFQVAAGRVKDLPFRKIGRCARRRSPPAQRDRGRRGAARRALAAQPVAEGGGQRVIADARDAGKRSRSGTGSKPTGATGRPASTSALAKAQGAMAALRPAAAASSM